MTHDVLIEAAATIARLGTGPELTSTIRDIEASLTGKQRQQAEETIAEREIDETLLSGALAIKDLAGQIHVIIHAVGILVTLPHILEPGERIESLSLGAGNTGRDHDLVTNRRIAEFKFIRWRGSDTIRQNNLFVDIFNLATANTEKRRCMYLVGQGNPVRFLQGRRAISSVLSRNASAARRFQARYGERFETVADYYAAHIETRIEIIDMAVLVPTFEA